MYNTKQRKEILDVFKNHRDSQLTAEEINDILIEEKMQIGIATIYRTLEHFEKHGILRKFTSNDKTCCCYQYVGEDGDCNNHYHLKCVKCGKIIHLKCSTMADLTDHIEKDHNFKIDKTQTILYGECGECAKKALASGSTDSPSSTGDGK